MAAQPLPSSSTADALWTSSPATSPSTRRADRQGRVVRSIAHKVTRPCSRNGCPAPARASMALDYAGKQVTLVPLLAERDPRFLEVCPTHAEGLDVPRGWDLLDERGEEAPEPTGPPTAEEMGSSSTVSILAAALRDVPDEPDLQVGVDQVVTMASEPEGPGVQDLGAARTFDLPVDAFDTLDGLDQPVPTPRAPTGRTAIPVSHIPEGGDARQLPLDDSVPSDLGRVPRRPRPVPAARTDDSLPPEMA